MTGMFIMAACMAGGFVLSYLMTYAFCKDESGEGKQKEKALPDLSKAGELGIYDAYSIIKQNSK